MWAIKVGNQHGCVVRKSEHDKAGRECVVWGSECESRRASRAGAGVPGGKPRVGADSEASPLALRPPHQSDDRMSSPKAESRDQ